VPRYVLEQVRLTYDGPVAMATDYMVFNITKENIRVRMAVVDEDIWPQPPAFGPKIAPDPSERVGYSEFITGGRLSYKEVVAKIYADINEKYGTDVPSPD
jgi:ribonuclease Z